MRLLAAGAVFSVIGSVISFGYAFRDAAAHNASDALSEGGFAALCLMSFIGIVVAIASISLYQSLAGKDAKKPSKEKT